jgi:hypothetical protein
MSKRFFPLGPSAWCIHAIALLALYCIFNLSTWKRSAVIETDGLSYYAYLPAAFIYHDLSLGFLSNPHPPPVSMWPLKTESGKLVIKTSMGMAVFYAPFFFAAQLFAPAFHDAATGYTPVYHFFLSFTSLLYFYLGLFVLRRILMRYFSDGVTALAIVAIALGTNMFYYVSVETLSAHPTAFFLITLFLYYTIRWHEHHKTFHVLALGICMGLLILVRPTHILVSLLFLFYEVRDLKTFQDKLRLLLANVRVLSLIPILVILIFIPQLLYWKMQTGHYLFNSYIGETFYFSKPHILAAWFSYRKGWLVYTPVMCFFFAGLWVMPERLKFWRLSILLFFCLSTYMLFCWWCWWYGGSFGMRTYIDYYGLFALPLAAFLEWSLSGRFRYSFGILTSILILLNLFQTYQYKRGVIHYDSMSRAKYWAVFLRLGEQTTESDKYLRPPDYAKAMKGEEKY